MKRRVYHVVRKGKQEKKVPRPFKADTIFKEMAIFMKKTSEHVLELKKENTEMKNMLKKVKDTNENVDGTLCNVLLAIRQNEYLQAWYPDHDKTKKVVNE